VIKIAPKELKKISEVVWELPISYKEGMLVPARVFATKKLIKDMDDGVFNQITNVACLPGIQKYAYCMPDGHWGYGFPIGGVAAFDLDKGIISPGGIGFDINCGMRLLTTNLTYEEVQPKLKELVDLLFKRVPTGVGCKGFLDITKDQFKEIMVKGVKWCVENDFGWKEDAENIEEGGCIKGADPTAVSDKAISRGIKQLGTLGSGNHYLEIQTIKENEIFDEEIAKKFGITKPGQIVVMIHCGSRGFGHQIGTDYLRIFNEKMADYKLSVTDRELACAPFKSKEGQDYYKAMACAANVAFVNRQIIMHRVRQCFSRVFEKSPEEMEMNLIYDVAHNIAKVEEHNLNGERKEVLVHRKGSTRAFGPFQKDLPKKYRETGQPIIIGGSMETGSYLLVGTQMAMDETFGSTAHGSGRTMSRSKAKHTFNGDQLQKDMEKNGIYVKSASITGLAEEAGCAYKNISEVVAALEMAGISKKVVALRPIGNIKG
jgi:tRNA-splicing ligase RtcB (3'-phosphate/5'-hydroxy nucleic acid ligase)